MNLLSMKNWLLIVFILSFQFTIQSQNLDWVVAASATGLDDAKSIARDASGNLLITGSFSGTGDYDPDSGGTVIKTKLINNYFLYLSKTN